MRTLVLFSVALTLGGCGGSKKSPADMAPPADLADTSGCHPPFQRSYIINKFSMRQQGDGFDLNGDGKPDNQLGALAGFANPKWNDAITKGLAIYLFNMNGLAGPPLTDGNVPEIDFFVGIDSDTDPTNNLSGTGAFYVPAEQYDVNCQTTASFGDVQIKGGMMTGDKSSVSVVAQGVGSLQFVNVKLVSTMNGDYSVYSGSLGDISTACALSLTPSGINSSSLLDVVAGTFQLQPDMDLDGDGLDTIQVDMNGVASCTSGSGVVIMGHDCPCDPRIKDGYSAAMDFTTVPAKILGLVAAQ